MASLSTTSPASTTTGMCRSSSTSLSTTRTTRRPDPIDKSEFAGSYVSVLPHKHKSKTKMNTCLRLDITELLEDLDAEGDENVVVTLVPRIGTGHVSIGGLKIEFVS